MYFALILVLLVSAQLASASSFAVYTPPVLHLSSGAGPWRHDHGLIFPLPDPKNVATVFLHTLQCAFIISEPRFHKELETDMELMHIKHCTEHIQMLKQYLQTKEVYNVDCDLFDSLDADYSSELTSPYKRPFQTFHRCYNAKSNIDDYTHTCFGELSQIIGLNFTTAVGSDYLVPNDHVSRYMDLLSEYHFSQLLWKQYKQHINPQEQSYLNTWHSPINIRWGAIALYCHDHSAITLQDRR